MANETVQQGGVGLQPGARIGKYEVKERLGSGGQAIVYKCYDALLDRYVAVKQISSHLAEDPRFLERFRKEAQILARLGTRQPAIVTIYELVEDERGLFIVMEHVEGKTLETVLGESKGPVEAKATLQILWRLAAALNNVHQAGIIHRDIKPANIIVGDGLRPKITDFGVAASVTGQTSMVLGTTKYMAPELLTGASFDGRADMYSLGFVIYEMLVGRAKFEEIFADIVRDKHSESLRWMKWHGNESAVAPGAHEMNPDVPRSISDVVARMMSKDPSKRFENMESLGRAIKSGFSPRAAAKAAPAVAGAHAAHAGGTPAKSAHAAPMDEGDEFDVPAPTAPLPKKKMATSTKLILAAVPVVLIVGVIIAMVVKSTIAATARVKEAVALYGDGEKLYNDSKYPESLEIFQKVLNGYHGTSQEKMSMVMVHMAKAQIALNDRKWDTAQTEQVAVEESLKQIDTNADQNLTKWIRRSEEDIKAFSNMRNNTWAVRTAMGKAKVEADKGSYDKARDVIKAATSGLSQLPAPLYKELMEFNKEIDHQELLTNIKDTLARAKTVGEQLPATAEKILMELQPTLDDPKTKSLLTEPERKVFVDDVKSRLAAIALGASETVLRKDIDTARKAGKKQEEVDAIDRLDRFLQKNTRALDTDLVARRTEIKSDILTDNADALVKKGQIDAAIALLKQAKALNPKNDRAVSMLATLTGAQEKEQLLGKADALLAAGDYKGALNFYEINKAKYGEKPDERARRYECHWRPALVDADTARKAKEYDKAVAILEDAIQYSPDNGSEARTIQAAILKEKSYANLMDQGNTLLAAKQWERAREAYTKAKPFVANLAEVNDKIAETWYGEFRDKALDAEAAGDEKNAKLFVEQAQTKKDTAEIRAIRERIYKKWPAPEPS